MMSKGKQYIIDWVYQYSVVDGLVIVMAAVNHMLCDLIGSHVTQSAYRGQRRAGERRREQYASQVLEAIERGH
jgi:hypothetical protein